MEDAYFVKLMPLAERAYLSLRQETRSLSADPSPSLSRRYSSEHFARVNQILVSLKDPGDVYLDQSLLERMSWLRTRNIDSTLVYFLRVEPRKLVTVLHITRFDNTNAYARFCAFMDAGGCNVLAELGVDIPIGYIGPSALLQ